LAVGHADVACIGDNCVDVYVGAFASERAGGNALNVAFELARAGYGAAYFGAVGDDERGRLILETARSRGVDTDGVVVEPGPTGVTVVEHDRTGERRFVEEDYGVAAEYRIDEHTARTAAAARWVHLARQPDAADWAGALAARGARLSADFGEHAAGSAPDPLCSRLGVAFFSLPSGDLDAAAALAADAVARGAVIGVVTLGARGSVAHCGTRSWHQAAVPVDVVDTLGAGDAFIAGFIAGLLDDEELPAALLRGAQAGADACTRVGLDDSPLSEEVQA